MKNPILKLICLLSVAVLLLSGCSWSSQNMPETPKTEKAELKLTTPLSVYGELKASDESVIATYSASFPQFEENSIVAQRINDVFAIVYDDAPIDMDSFFNHIKTQLGEKWELKSFAEPFHTITVEYSQIPSTEDYICFLSEYIISENESESIYPGVSMFLKSTGWSLTYETLFGDNTHKATQLLIEQITDWCIANGVPTEALYQLNSKFFNGKFGISEQHVFVCFDPYFFSTQYDKSITIYLPQSSFMPLLIEQSHK